MKRRDFLKTTAITAGALSIAKTISANAITGDKMPNAAQLPQRQYGKNDVQLSVIGFGGIVVMGSEPDQANRIVSEAFERGVNYYDVAPTYGKGEAELKLGPALSPYRKKCFLACKTTQRTYDAAKVEFERSLQRLKTDYFDLYQLHAITDVKKDVDAAFSQDGTMKLLMEAKREGRVRYLGFSAHSHKAALAAMERYDFDSILFPVNFVNVYKGGFGPEVIETAHKKGTAILALKMFARQKWGPGTQDIRKQYPKCWYEPVTEKSEAELAMAFTLSQPVTSAIPPGDAKLFRLALDLAFGTKPITESQIKKAKTIAMKLHPIFVNTDKKKQ